MKYLPLVIVVLAIAILACGTQPEEVVIVQVTAPPRPTATLIAPAPQECIGMPVERAAALVGGDWDYQPEAAYLFGGDWLLALHTEGGYVVALGFVANLETQTQTDNAIDAAAKFLDTCGVDAIGILDGITDNCTSGSQSCYFTTGGLQFYGEYDLTGVPAFIGVIAPIGVEHEQG